MRRRLLNILLLIALSAPLWAIEVPCGTLLEIRATGHENWHFVHWDDGNTDSVRIIEATEDTQLMAFFAHNCVTYTLPVVALYDWLLMLDMKTIHEHGYFFDEEDVTWYRVRGLGPDIQEEDVWSDDEPLTTGYYLTIDRSFAGTGDYYAVARVTESPSGELCRDHLTSELIHYASNQAPAQTPLLTPTRVLPNETLQLLRLNPEYPTTVTVYDLSGRLLQTLTADGVTRLCLQAQTVAGCYQLIVYNGDTRHVLRYIVVK